MAGGQGFYRSVLWSSTDPISRVLQTAVQMNQAAAVRIWYMEIGKGWKMEKEERLMWAGVREDYVVL